MKNNLKKLSPAVFVLALICFLLPFVTFSCHGQKVMTLSGIQLVAGASLKQPQMLGPPKSQKMGAEPLAIAAFLCAILGLALSFLKGRVGAIAPAAVGGLAAILLLALKSKLDGDAVKEGGGMIQVNYDVGFYAVVILFLAAVALNIYVLLKGTSVPLPVLKADEGSKFCTQCGSKNPSTYASCKECGAKFE